MFPICTVYRVDSQLDTRNTSITQCPLQGVNLEVCTSGSKPALPGSQQSKNEFKNLNMIK